MSLLTARLRKLEKASGIDDPFSLLTDEELEAAIAALGYSIRAVTGMSPEEYENLLKEVGKQPRIDNEHAWELVRSIKSGELDNAGAA